MNAKERSVIEELKHGAQTVSLLGIALNVDPAQMNRMVEGLAQQGVVAFIGRKAGKHANTDGARIVALAEHAEAEKRRLTKAKRMTSGSGVIAGPVTVGRGFRCGSSLV